MRVPWLELLGVPLWDFSMETGHLAKVNRERIEEKVVRKKFNWGEDHLNESQFDEDDLGEAHCDQEQSEEDYFDEDHSDECHADEGHTGGW